MRARGLFGCLRGARSGDVDNSIHITTKTFIFFSRERACSTYTGRSAGRSSAEGRVPGLSGRAGHGRVRRRRGLHPPRRTDGPQRARRRLGMNAGNSGRTTRHTTLTHRLAPACAGLGVTTGARGVPVGVGGGDLRARCPVGVMCDEFQMIETGPHTHPRPCTASSDNCGAHQGKTPPSPSARAPMAACADRVARDYADLVAGGATAAQL
jgi:hypothetical protein